MNLPKLPEGSDTINDDTVDLITLLTDLGWGHERIVRACGGVIKLELSLDRVLGKEVPTRTDCN